MYLYLFIKSLLKLSTHTHHTTSQNSLSLIHIHPKSIETQHSHTPHHIAKPTYTYSSKVYWNSALTHTPHRRNHLYLFIEKSTETQHSHSTPHHITEASYTYSSKSLLKLSTHTHHRTQLYLFIQSLLKLSTHTQHTTSQNPVILIYPKSDMRFPNFRFDWKKQWGSGGRRRHTVGSRGEALGGGEGATPPEAEDFS